MNTTPMKPAPGHSIIRCALLSTRRVSMESARTIPPARISCRL
jgi:hypothetical protein